jgi:microcystin degradation protein MlrC
MARIAIGGFHHETNCFIPARTDFDAFSTIGDRPPD